MPFGRYRGLPIGELPDSYLEWLAHPDAGGEPSKMVAVNTTAEWLRRQARSLP